MTVRELTRDQLDELKSAFFWDPDTQGILPQDIVFPDEIPDDMIFSHYSGICFVEDDFFTCQEG